jgi:SpoIID/LytB domain protein
VFGGKLMRRIRKSIARAVTLSVAAAATLAVAASADAATIFQINGGGNGHGIGMSQYGALGYALHGESYAFILSHYYLGAVLGSTNPDQTVRVLLGVGPASFSGASQAGSHKLKPSFTYSVRALADGSLALYTQSGKKVATFSAPLSVTGPGPLSAGSYGAYRGALEFRPAGSAVQTVNAVALDDYVRGVIAAEMPASWPAAALEAQAVAARTYAITSDVRGNGYQLYPDTRSQMYGGVAAETPSTDAAVAATNGQIVTYDGAPVTTYFFSSAGGHTENIENVWLGATPEPWLKGVRDPYDAAGGDPYHRWTVRMTIAQAKSTLGSLVKGTLRGIRVTKRGVSPRVVTAQVVGTRGQTSVTGPQLQSAFGLLSTYMRFTTISASRVVRPRASVDALWRLRPAALRAVLGGPPSLSGAVFPASRGAAVVLQHWTRHGWRNVGRTRIGTEGTYQLADPGSGSYRVLYDQVAGPTVTFG